MHISRKQGLAAVIAVLLCLTMAAIYVILDPENQTLDADTRKRIGGTYIELSDGITHYRLEGPEAGPLVVLVHGGTIPMWTWDSQARALATEGFRVLRYDAFGRGYSDRPAVQYTQQLYRRQLNELIQRLEITTPFDLIGVSLGGGTAINFTARYPEKVRKLILIAPLVKGYKIPGIFRVPIIGEYCARLAGRRLLLTRFEALYHHNSKLSYYQNLFVEQTTFKGFQHSLLSMMRHDLLRDYSPAYQTVGNQERQSLLIWGTADAEISLEMIDTIRTLIPLIDYHPMEGSGHGIVARNPEKINKLLLEYLETTP